MAQHQGSVHSADGRGANGQLSYCALPHVVEREIRPSIEPNRARLIRLNEKKWVNGTVLHYYFFDQPSDGQRAFFADGTSGWRSWTTGEAEMQVVRRAFEAWKEVGIGLEFREVGTRDEAEIRIGFMRGDGAWCYVGRDILGVGRDDRTMNFGWDLTHPGEIDTAIHEIGHTLGFPHEHQNPNAGIVWDEEAVYAALAKPPNRWDRARTYYNIIRKVDPALVQGSDWDPDSIMHYPFEAGLILEPEAYRAGLNPAPGLSKRDRTWARTFYPPLDEPEDVELKPCQSMPLSIMPGEQRNFVIRPERTRGYDIRTFGSSDTVMVLFEDVNGELRYRTGDDDSGEDTNASMRVKLFQGRRYVLRIRLYYSTRAGETVVMMW